MLTIKIRENWIQKQLNVFLWNILQLKRDISAINLHPNFFFVLVDITFHESESYFTTPYLQKENSIRDDKDQESFLMDPFLINLPKVSMPISDPPLSLSHLEMR